MEEMTYKFENFCLQVDNFLNKEECEEMIELFNVYNESNVTFDRRYQTETAHDISDKAMFSQDVIWNHRDIVTKTPNLIHIGFNTIERVNLKFWQEVFPIYGKKYSILDGYPAFSNTILKIQRTKVGGEGYHVWHSEDSGWDTRDRILTWILYLNDVEEGGETEMLYLSKRYKAKQGRLLLFPGSFTHTHRGNPPLSNTKYIATGWIQPKID
jgi:hypothetical protein